MTKSNVVAAPTAAGAGRDLSVPDTMKAWVLNGPGELVLQDKPVPVPGKAEVLVRIDAVAICATDLDVIGHGPPALIQGGMPFNKGFTPGHEYMGTVVKLGPGVDEYRLGQRVTVEIHAGCGQCKRCREGMYTSCHNYGLNYGAVDKGHRANGFTTDGGFCEYQVNHINTLIPIADDMSDEEATLVVTAGTAMYGLTELGGLVAGESVVVVGPGPIGLLGVAVAKALGAHPVILTGTRDNRLTTGLELGADHVVNVTREDAVEAVRRLNGGKGVDYVLECSGAPNAVNEAARMVNRGGKICLAAFHTSRCRSTSPTSCATTSTSMASAARARAPRTGPRPSCGRSASMRPGSTLTPSRLRIFQPPCATRGSGWRMLSRWS
jgi:threonine dehydrogenase-like Zn-dependent dehydrogenase